MSARPPLAHARSLLFLPASNARAAAKARTLPCDMVILDLEDAVADADKDAARDGAAAALAGGFGARLTAVRINGADTPWHQADLAAVRAARPDYVVLPKAAAGAARAVADGCGRPVIAMIETARGLLEAGTIAAEAAVAALMVGANDLRADMNIPAAPTRDALALALQMVLLAARAAGKPAFDAVFNRLDDAAGFAAEAATGRALGFDGKTLIHPDQVAPANRAFGPDPAAVRAARRLIAAAGAGAWRHEGEMVEGMHLAAARALVARAAAYSDGSAAP